MQSGSVNSWRSSVSLCGLGWISSHEYNMNPANKIDLKHRPCNNSFMSPPPLFTYLSEIILWKLVPTYYWDFVLLVDKWHINIIASYCIQNMWQLQKNVIALPVIGQRDTLLWRNKQLPSQRALPLPSYSLFRHFPSTHWKFSEN